MSNLHHIKALTIEGCATVHCTVLQTWQSVPSLWEARGGRAPLVTACVPPFRVTEKNVFGISRDDKTAENDGKKNNDIETCELYR